MCVVEEASQCSLINNSFITKNHHNKTTDHSQTRVAWVPVCSCHPSTLCQWQTMPRTTRGEMLTQNSIWFPGNNNNNNKVFMIRDKRILVPFLKSFQRNDLRMATKLLHCSRPLKLSPPISSRSGSQNKRQRKEPQNTTVVFDSRPLCDLTANSVAVRGREREREREG